MSMPKLVPERPHILFLFSDTGGGHRSATEAVIEALGLEYQDRISTEMVDILKDYSPLPFNALPAIYPLMVKAPRVWGTGYHLSDGRRRTRLLNTLAWPYVRQSLQRLISRHPCHLIVSAHPLSNDPVVRALGPCRPVFITMVTDMVDTHALWYHSGVDLCIVPTEAARRRALEHGLSPDQVIATGLPVADRFCRTDGARNTLRGRFGWPSDRFTVLLVGGGEGMGPIKQSARAIAEGCPAATLVIIAGRNQKLKDQLTELDWPIPTFVYGFIDEMPEFMRAADVLVTKAGPGTISEALIAGLPMVIYSRLPGQEDGNVQYVVAERAGVWAPRVEQIVAAIQTWQADPQAHAEAVRACQRIARPNAARRIAKILAESVNAEAGVQF
jgi:1,2-diacylglycerol 3-beta-galactosyltransferase